MSESKLNHEIFSPLPVLLKHKNPVPVPDVHKEKVVPSTRTNSKTHDKLNTNVTRKVKPISSSSPSPSLSPSQGKRELNKVDLSPTSAKSLGINNNRSNSTSPSPKRYREPLNAGETFKQSVSSSPKPHVSKSNSKSGTKTEFEFESEVSRVKTAIKDGHIFEIRGVVNSAVREALVKRGWIERKKENGNGNGKREKYVVPKTRKSLSQTHSQNQNHSQNHTAQISEQSKPNSKSNSNSTSKSKSKSSSNLKTRSKSRSKCGLTSEIDLWTQEILSRLPPNLIWTDNKTEFSWKKISDWQYVNKLPQSGSVEKRGILDRIQTLHWFSNEARASAASFHPRTYRLYNNEEKSVFLQDYRLTSCMALLKWFVYSSKQEPESNAMVDFDKSSLFLVDFALRQVKHYVRVRRHLDIDDDRHGHGHSHSESASKHAPQIREWDLFLHKSNQILQRKGKLTTVTKTISATKSDAIKLVKDKYQDAKMALKEITPFWPQIDIDGMNNVWIFKPGEGSLGKGIIVLDQYEEIALRFIGEDTQNSTWLAQKYVENPLLVKKTKFDIRQWFLISSWNPLTVWMYRQSYIRFASTDFRLDDLSEKIHLTNASVQQKYRADPSRDWHIPMNNMWCSATFQTYLSSIGKPNVWKKLIYPEMKKIILSILFATRPTVRHQERSFQILGADFLLSDDYRPWLIEINSCPTMSSNTSVKRKLCPQCIEDAFKVILDWVNDDTIETGDFELLYRAKEPLPQPVAQKLRSMDKVIVSKKGRTPREKAKKGTGEQSESGNENESKNDNENDSDSDSDIEIQIESQSENESDRENLEDTIEKQDQTFDDSPSFSTTAVHFPTAFSVAKVNSIVDQSPHPHTIPVQDPAEFPDPDLTQVNALDRAPDLDLELDLELKSAPTPTHTKTNLHDDSNVNSNNIS